MASQPGSFAIDMTWLVAGAIYWWPVVCPVPERRFPYVAKIGYLLLNTILNTLPYAFLVFGELPFYATYELAPPVGGLSAREDQRIAGLIMKLGGGVVFWTAIGILFFRWYRAEEGRPGA
jgi:cytochrome c oxidase assembly factor CtaG